jgi:hypothetical protein
LVLSWSHSKGQGQCSHVWPGRFHETQTAEKIFLFISFFLGEKLCLKICTVVDKVIENRFLLKRKPAFLLKHDFFTWF